MLGPCVSVPAPLPQRHILSQEMGHHSEGRLGLGRDSPRCLCLKLGAEASPKG